MPLDARRAAGIWMVAFLMFGSKDPEVADDDTSHGAFRRSVHATPPPIRWYLYGSSGTASAKTTCFPSRNSIRTLFLWIFSRTVPGPKRWWRTRWPTWKVRMGSYSTP